ncbi:MAG: HK97 family phage prohead protease [Streptosporangiales bacterium]
MATDKGNITTPDAGDLNAAAKRYAASQGWAMDDGSYPIRPADNHGRTDLEKAISAVGRGSGSHDAIRQHIIRRAKALGLSDLIPENWNSDGSLRSMGMETERRYTPGTVELRAAGDAKRIGGYGAVFGVLSRNLGGFVEQVGTGAFNQARAAGWPNVVARYNHDSNMILGTTGGSTLDLRVDPGAGLWYEVEPPQSRADILELVQRGDVRYSSFAFRVLDDDWAVTDQSYPMRTLNEVELIDVAPVHDPAYLDTSAGLRSLAAYFDADFEEVRSMAVDDELRRFFVRSDTESTAAPVKRLFGPAAAVDLLAKKTDPWA